MELLSDTNSSLPLSSQILEQQNIPTCGLFPIMSSYHATKLLYSKTASKQANMQETQAYDSALWTLFCAVTKVLLHYEGERQVRLEDLFFKKERHRSRRVCKKPSGLF